jgi:hypothetical protein
VQPSFQKHQKRWDFDPSASIELEGIDFKLRGSRLTIQSASAI